MPTNPNPTPSQIAQSIKTYPQSAAAQAEEALNNPVGSYGGSALSFPRTLSTEWRHIMHFQRYEYSRADARATPTESAAGSLISLPIPENLKSSYSAGWENIELGLTGNQMQNAAGDVLKGMNGNLDFSSFGDSLGKFAGTGLGAKAKNFMVALGLEKLAGTSIGQVTSRATGMAVNPFKAVLYNSPDFRNFSFQYKFIASSIQEVNTIRSIHKEFKLGMHPSLNTPFEDNIFKYPDVWRLTIPDDEYLFKFLTCVLTQAEFDFHGEGTKTYFKGEAKNMPLSINASLSFQEVAILTKEDIEKGF